MLAIETFDVYSWLDICNDMNTLISIEAEYSLEELAIYYRTNYIVVQNMISNVWHMLSGTWTHERKFVVRHLKIHVNELKIEINKTVLISIQ